MAPIQPPQPERDFGGYAGFEGDSDGFPRSRKVVRYGVPVAIAGVAAATIGLGTALASTGGGPSLPHITAEQLLDKIATSKVQTVSGSVQVTTNLGLPDGLLGGAMGGATGGGAGPFGQHGGGKGGSGGSAADPQAKLTELLSGSHTLRVAADGPDRQRVSIVDNTSEYTVVHNGDQMWAYDSASNAVYHQTGQRGAKGEHHAEDKNLPATPQEAVKQALKNVGPTTSVSVDGTAEVAGQHAYQLLIKPKQADSTVDSIRVAVDADNGVPLKFTLTPKGGGAAAVDIGYTKVDFGKPAASTFGFSVPKGAKVTEGKDNGQGRGAQDHGGMSGLNVIGKDWDSVAELKSADGQLPSGKGDKAGESKTSAQGLLGSFGHRVKGAFGTGTVINTRLVNVLITDKGAVYAGAVNQDALVKAAK
ncbi:DUF2092 domain-containing protein [Streptomyces sp. NPDC020096]